MPRSGFCQLRDRHLHLTLQDRPDTLVERVAGAGMQVDAVEQRPPNIVLLLLVGGVSGPHRLRALDSR